MSNWTAIKRDVCTEMGDAAFANIKGGTDSEHLAALYMTFLTGGGTDATAFTRFYPIEMMAEAMHRAVKTVISAQKKLLGKKAAPNSLNLCATDGVNMIAYRFRNHATEAPPSLYYSTKAGTTLNRKYPDRADGMDVPGRYSGKAVESHGKHLIVASEPSTYKKEDWTLIGRNQVLLAEADGKFEVRNVPYKKDWDVEDPYA